MLTFSPPVAGWQAGWQPVSGWPTLGPQWPPGPFNAVHGREELNLGHRAPPPPPLLFAMPGAPLASSHFAQHALCVPTPLSTAMHETLYWPAAALSATQTKFQDRAQLRKGPGSLYRGRAGNTERERGRGCRACTLVGCRRVDVAQRKAGQTHYRLLRAQGYGGRAQQAQAIG